eukprot:1683768-Rhodomonas_salina.2
MREYDGTSMPQCRAHSGMRGSSDVPGGILFPDEACQENPNPRTPIAAIRNYPRIERGMKYQYPAVHENYKGTDWYRCRMGTWVPGTRVPETNVDLGIGYPGTRSKSKQ